jgi:hypothetical protein
MRWFTREWQRGDLADGEDEARRAGYAAYVDSIAGRVPERVLAFALPRERHMAVDDALLDLLEVDAAGRRVRLRLLNGDLPTGYGILDLEFAGAELVGPAVGELAALFADPRTEFLVHEVWLAGDGSGMEARFLLWPDGELAIAFADLAAGWAPIADTTRSARRNLVAVIE